MPTLYQLAQAQRKALLDRDSTTALRLIESYAEVNKNLNSRLTALTDLIELRRANGEEISLAWLNREERFTALLDQVEAEIQRLGEMTRQETAAMARQATADGRSDAAALITQASEEAGIQANFNNLPRRATEAIVSATQPDTALSRIFDEYGKDARDKAAKALTIGISTGQNPRVIAGELSRVTGASLSRSLLIARTEGMRAYRSASLLAYQENNLVEQWQWLSTKSLRSCAACISNDGRIFNKSEPFAGHVRCRCTPLPVLSTGPRPRKLASEWFAEQDETDQIKVLGIEGTRLYRAGGVSLEDYVRITHHDDYGKSFVKGSNKSALLKAR